MCCFEHKWGSRISHVELTFEKIAQTLVYFIKDY